MAVSNVELRVSATQAITALKNVDTQAKKFNQTVNGTQSKLKDANKNLAILPKTFFKTGAAAKTAAGGIRAAGGAIQSALLPILGITTAVAAFTKAFGVLAQQDFAIAKVRTLGVDVDALQPKLATLSNELSGQASSLDLLSASYDVASAGFGKTAQLTDVLKASQLGATGGFSDLATVADATTSVLNAYGLSSDKAAKLVDGFIQTQNDGKIVVDQYAQQIGRLAPIAAGAGVGIDELNAAISTVTATGVPVESTFAGLRQVIAAIQKPTTEASRAAEKLGVDFSATALSTKGLGGVLTELIQKGGASEETLAQFFGSVEARTAILPLLNDQLVSFNKNLDNQAKAQGTAAQAAFTAQNTIQGQLTRLGAAFTNLTADGSEFGIIIRETLKVAAVTVEGLAAAFKVVASPVRALFAAVNQIGTAIANALGVDTQNTLFELEQGWIRVKENVTKFTDGVILAGKVVGGVVVGITKAVIPVIQSIFTFAQNVRNKIIEIFNTVVTKIREVIKKVPFLDKFIKGGVKVKATVETGLENVTDFGKDLFKDGIENVQKLIDGVVQFAEVQGGVKITTEDIEGAVNNIVTTIPTINNELNKTDEKTEKVKTNAEKLAERFQQIGDSIRQGIVSNLTDAVMGTKTLAEAAINVLDNLKRKLVELAIQKAFAGIGGMIGGPVGGFLSGFFAKGGRPPVGKAAIVGERGPELFVPSVAGTVIPNTDIGVGGGNTNIINVSVDASGTQAEGDDATSSQLGKLIGLAVQQELVKQSRAGGLLSRA